MNEALGLQGSVERTWSVSRQFVDLSKFFSWLEMTLGGALNLHTPRKENVRTWCYKSKEEKIFQSHRIVPEDVIIIHN